MKTIALTNSSLVAIIDDDDFDKVEQRGKWYLTLRGYVRSTTRPHVFLHHFVGGVPPKGKQTDHRFGNKLDNRKTELRFATPCQNCQNAFRLPPNGLKGISWHRASGKWRAEVRFNSRKVHLGLFEDKLLAARAYDEAAKKYHGEFARTNR